MTNEESLPKKVRLSEADFKVMARDELILRWKQYEAYVQALEGKYTDLNCKLEFQLPKDYVNISFQIVVISTGQLVLLSNVYSRILLRTYVQALLLMLGSRNMKET